MSERVKLRVRGKVVTVPLEAPASYATKADVHAAGSPGGMLRPMVAALGLCWAGPHPPKASYRACGYNPLVYGGQVLDELVGLGVEVPSIMEAAAVAWRLIAEGLIPAEVVASAEEAFPDEPASESDRHDGAGERVGPRPLRSA